MNPIYKIYINFWVDIDWKMHENFLLNLSLLPFIFIHT